MMQTKKGAAIATPFLILSRGILLHRTGGLQLLEEVVTLVVDEDECGEVFHLNLPDSLHAELGILNALDALDVVLCEDSSRTTD